MGKKDQRKATMHDLLTNLINLGRTDTLYRDIYIKRARYYLEPELSYDGYLQLKRMQTREASLPNQIRNAMIRSDWRSVHELSGMEKTLKKELDEKRPLEEFAREIYGSHEIPIDPFSPGMHKLAGFSTDRLTGLRNDILRQLKELSQWDRDRAEFYRQRSEAFTALNVNTKGFDASSQRPSAMVLEEEAAQAFESGDMARLEILTEKLLQESKQSDNSMTPAELLEGVHKAPASYLYEFPRKVLEKAAGLGLEHYTVPSHSDEYEPFLRFAWHPTYADLQNNHSGVLRVPELPLPKDFPEALKSRIQLYAMHPFINSAGVRFLPNMVAENVLVENFPEPEEGSKLPSSGLLEALGLKRRNQLSRQQIETVLLEKGSEILRNQLGLDPNEYRLVCIPPDLHLRIGQECGWGQQQIWTHFDGYMVMADTSRRALAGGDVRFGGIYDLLGLSCSYDSDRVIARFAVVQRRRMALWQ
jgi:hypothetical protein